METRQTRSKKNSSFIIQGSIYAISAIISSVIGLIYRIPLTRIIGDEGNGYYQAAFNIYTYVLLLSSYSLPLAVSKMVSARVGKGMIKSTRRILKASLGYATVVGGTASLVIWFGAGWFSSVALHMPLSYNALLCMTPTVWIVSYLGVMRGYYQGYSTMVPTAWSQIIEQIINAVVSVWAAFALTKVAISQMLPVSSQRAYGAAGGTIGTGAGALGAFIMFIILFFSQRKKRRAELEKDKTTVPESYSEITRILFLTVVPVILSTAIYNLTGIVDNIVFAYSNSLADAAKTAGDYGIYTAKYKLLINVPVAIANALSSSLVPALSRANAAGEKKVVNTSAGKAIRFAMLVSIPSAVGMAILAHPIITLLFGSSPKAEFMMSVGTASVVFYSLSTISNGILQGTSHMRLPVIHSLISLFLHIMLLFAFLRIGKMGIFGVVYADMFFALCMCILNALSIKKNLSYKQEIKRTFVIPLICAMLMGLITYLIYSGLGLMTGNLFIRTMIPVISAVVIYFSLLIKSGSLNEQELLAFPMGGKLVKIAKILHLF